MRFSHIGLPVRDERRSQQFYSAYFGFDPATAQRYADGTVIIRNADGFDLALHPVEHIGPSPAFLHAGFKTTAPADVRTLMERMEADGVPIVERNDEASYTAFKCLDPDGHRIEVYWEPPLPDGAEHRDGPQGRRRAPLSGQGWWLWLARRLRGDAICSGALSGAHGLMQEAVHNGGEREYWHHSDGAGSVIGCRLVTRRIFHVAPCRITWERRIRPWVQSDR